MGVSLTYKTTTAVAAKVKAAILADAKRINRERNWWCEGLCFFEPRPKTGRVIGDTKLFFAGVYSDEDEEGGLHDVDADDDDFMGFRDAAFIVRQLVHWSAEHGVDWTLEMSGVEMGTIRAGTLDPANLFGCDKAPTAAAQKKAARLNKKYASRNG